jgi:hypothetical protein
MRYNTDKCKVIFVIILKAKFLWHLQFLIITYLNGRQVKLRMIRETKRRKRKYFIRKAKELFQE